MFSPCAYPFLFWTFFFVSTTKAAEPVAKSRFEFREGTTEKLAYWWEEPPLVLLNKPLDWATQGANSWLTPGPPGSVGRDYSTGNLCFESASVALRPRSPDRQLLAGMLGHTAFPSGSTPLNLAHIHYIDFDVDGQVDVIYDGFGPGFPSLAGFVFFKNDGAHLQLFLKLTGQIVELQQDKEGAVVGFVRYRPGCCGNVVNTLDSWTYTSETERSPHKNSDWGPFFREGTDNFVRTDSMSFLRGTKLPNMLGDPQTRSVEASTPITIRPGTGVPLPLDAIFIMVGIPTEPGEGTTAREMMGNYVVGELAPQAHVQVLARERHEGEDWLFIRATKCIVAQGLLTEFKEETELVGWIPQGATKPWG
jgi:hypothetical protein